MLDDWYKDSLLIFIQTDVSSKTFTSKVIIMLENIENLRKA